mmetsp:Transcript_14244/g.35339  ORF Transcript_14244/g.35339 Transcript_14244/m.35339 type:complete len:1556 (-) Transcript_14244:1011-5678(-)
MSSSLSTLHQNVDGNGRKRRSSGADSVTTANPFLKSGVLTSSSSAQHLQREAGQLLTQQHQDAVLTTSASSAAARGSHSQRDHGDDPAAPTTTLRSSSKAGSTEGGGSYNNREHENLHQQQHQSMISPLGRTKYVGVTPAHDFNNITRADNLESPFNGSPLYSDGGGNSSGGRKVLKRQPRSSAKLLRVGHGLAPCLGSGGTADPASVSSKKQYRELLELMSSGRKEMEANPYERNTRGSASASARAALYADDLHPEPEGGQQVMEQMGRSPGQGQNSGISKGFEPDELGKTRKFHRPSTSTFSAGGARRGDDLPRESSGEEINIAGAVQELDGPGFLIERFARKHEQRMTASPATIICEQDGPGFGVKRLEPARKQQDEDLYQEDDPDPSAEGGRTANHDSAATSTAGEAGDAVVEQDGPGFLIERFARQQQESFAPNKQEPVTSSRSKARASGSGSDHAAPLPLDHDGPGFLIEKLARRNDALRAATAPRTPELNQEVADSQSDVHDVIRENDGPGFFVERLARRNDQAARVSFHPQHATRPEELDRDGPGFLVEKFAKRNEQMLTRNGCNELLNDKDSVLKNKSFTSDGLELSHTCSDMSGAGAGEQHPPQHFLNERDYNYDAAVEQREDDHDFMSQSQSHSEQDEFYTVAERDNHSYSHGGVGGEYPGATPRIFTGVGGTTITSTSNRKHSKSSAIAKPQHQPATKANHNLATGTNKRSAPSGADAGAGPHPYSVEEQEQDSDHAGGGGNASDHDDQGVVLEGAEDDEIANDPRREKNSVHATWQRYLPNLDDTSLSIVRIGEELARSGRKKYNDLVGGEQKSEGTMIEDEGEGVPRKNNFAAHPGKVREQAVVAASTFDSSCVARSSSRSTIGKQTAAAGGGMPRRAPAGGSFPAMGGRRTSAEYRCTPTLTGGGVPLKQESPVSTLMDRQQREPKYSPTLLRRPNLGHQTLCPLQDDLSRRPVSSSPQKRSPSSQPEYENADVLGSSSRRAPARSRSPVNKTRNRDKHADIDALRGTCTSTATEELLRSARNLLGQHQPHQAESRSKTGHIDGGAPGGGGGAASEDAGVVHLGAGANDYDIRISAQSSVDEHFRVASCALSGTKTKEEEDAPGPKSWSVDRVLAWASAEQLPEKVMEVLHHEEIDGEVLASLKEEDMAVLGLEKFGHRRALMLKVRMLLNRGSSPAGEGDIPARSTPAPTVGEPQRSRARAQRAPEEFRSIRGGAGDYQGNTGGGGSKREDLQIPVSQSYAYNPFARRRQMRQVGASSVDDNFQLKYYPPDAVAEDGGHPPTPFGAQVQPFDRSHPLSSLTRSVPHFPRIWHSNSAAMAGGSTATTPASNHSNSITVLQPASERAGEYEYQNNEKQEAGTTEPNSYRIRYHEASRSAQVGLAVQRAVVLQQPTPTSTTSLSSSTRTFDPQTQSATVQINRGQTAHRGANIDMQMNLARLELDPHPTASRRRHQYAAHDLSARTLSSTGGGGGSRGDNENTNSLEPSMLKHSWTSVSSGTGDAWREGGATKETNTNLRAWAPGGQPVPGYLQSADLGRRR